MSTNFSNNTTEAIGVSLKSVREYYQKLRAKNPAKKRMCSRELKFLKNTIMMWDFKTLSVHTIWRIRYALDDAFEFGLISEEQYQNAVEELIPLQIDLY